MPGHATKTRTVPGADLERPVVATATRVTSGTAAVLPYPNLDALSTRGPDLERLTGGRRHARHERHRGGVTLTLN